MTKANATRLRIKLGSLELEFEGADNFLRSEVPKLLKAADTLQVNRIGPSVDSIRADVDETLSVKAEAEKLINEIKSDLDSMSEMGEMESLRLQMMMDRLAKAMSTISNLLKKISETAEQITQNLK